MKSDEVVHRTVEGQRWKATATEGVEYCGLRSHGTDGGASFLVRIAQGARVPLHDHPGGEEIYVVGGRAQEHAELDLARCAHRLVVAVQKLRTLDLLVEDVGRVARVRDLHHVEHVERVVTHLDARVRGQAYGGGVAILALPVEVPTAVREALGLRIVAARRDRAAFAHQRAQ